MANSPFFVDPGNDFSSGLNGLSGTLSNIRQDRMLAAEQQKRDQAEAEAKQRMADASAAAQQAYASGDPDLMARTSLQYPEIANNLRQQIGLNDERKVKDAASFARDVLLATPEEREGVFKNRIQMLQDQGRDPSHTAQAYQKYLKNPNQAMQGIELDWAAGDPQGYSVVAEKARAEAKAAADAAKIQREDERFDHSEAGKDRRAAMSASDRALTREIAVLTAKQNAEMNALKREELGQKIEDKKMKQQESLNKQQAAADSSVATFDQAIGSADRLLKHPGLGNAVGIRSLAPTLPGSDAANFEAELDTLKAQTFLPQVAALKGAGALSDAEGKKLSDSIGALSVKMSKPAFEASLNRVKQTLENAKARSAKTAPTRPHPQAQQSGTAMPADIQDLLNKY